MNDVSNELKVFDNPEFGSVRTIEKDGEPWFVAADVCKALDLGNDRQALARLDEDEKGVISNDICQGRSELLNCVNEPGLYSLILGSRKPEAKAFKRWITHDVIPTIRRHGAYMTPDMVEQVLSNPDTVIRLATELKDERNRRMALQATNSALTVQTEIMRPKAEYFDELVERGVNLTFRESAKEIGVKEKVFVKFLLEHKYVFRDKKGKLLPYAQHDGNLFTVKECFNEKTAWGGTQTLITPKGRETFRLLMVGVA